MKTYYYFDTGEEVKDNDIFYYEDEEDYKNSGIGIIREYNGILKMKFVVAYNDKKNKFDIIDDMYVPVRYVFEDETLYRRYKKIGTFKYDKDKLTPEHLNLLTNKNQ